MHVTWHVQYVLSSTVSDLRTYISPICTPLTPQMCLSAYVCTYVRTCVHSTQGLLQSPLYTRSTVHEDHCTQGPLYMRTTVHKVHCTCGPRYTRSTVHGVHCTRGPLYMRSTVQEVHCTGGPLYMRTTVQEVHCT